MPSRRNVLSAVAASPLLAVLPPLSSARADVGDESGPAPDPHGGARTYEPRGVEGPIGALDLAGGFRVVRTQNVLYGALPFVLEGEGDRFQVDVLRRHSGASGAYDSAHLSCFVVGGATVLTSAARVRGARALGEALEHVYGESPVLATLSTFDERAAAHPHAAFGIDGEIEADS